MAKTKNAEPDTTDYSAQLSGALDKVTPVLDQTLTDALDFDFDSLGELDRVQVDVDGYWNPERSPIYGTLLGVAKAIETDMGVTGIYAIQLLKPCAGREGSSQDSEEKVFQPGQVMGVFHSFGLNPLKEMGGAKVAIRRLSEQQSLANGKSMWKYDIRATKERARIQIIDNRSPENSGAPF